ncbi:MAG: HEXXH motif domain-containing protein [Frankia sp.]
MTGTAQTTDLPTWRLPGAEFDALATGGGTSVGVLRDAQLSKRLLLLRTVVDTAAQRAPSEHERARLGESYRVLATAQASNRTAVDELLLLPQIGRWAMRCLRQLVGSTPGRAAADLGYLGGIAASAALHAGTDAEVTIRTDGVAVMLPSYGLAMLARPAGTDQRVAVHDGSADLCLPAGRRISVPVDPGGTSPAETWATGTGVAGTRAAETWHPARHLRADADGIALRIYLDDLDPYRGFDDLNPAPRLSAAEVADWQSRLEDAWRLLVRHHRARAEAIAAGVTCLIPLRGQDDHEEVSASSAEAFGAVALTLPRDGVGLAAALVHESQHAKLSALLDLVALHQVRPRREFYAPWRVDPRPLGGLFQGTYAYLGVTDFWQTQRRLVDGPARRIADFEVARWRDQVRHAVETLERSDALTEAGRRFVRGMRSRVDQIRVDDVPPAELLLAQDAVRDHEIGWRLRNLRPRASDVAAWTDAWLAGRTPPGVAAPSTVADSRPRFSANRRLGLTYLRLREPERFSELARDPVRLAAAGARGSRDRPDQPVGDQPDDGAIADACDVSGDLDGAIDAYRRQLRRDPTRLDGWTGLALARRRQNPRPGRRDPFVATPERVLAMHREIAARTGDHADPGQLAAWLATAAPASVPHQTRGSSGD